MNSAFINFIRGFYNSVERLAKNNNIFLSDFEESFSDGTINFISINTVIKSNEDDELLENIKERIDDLIAINKRPRKHLKTEEIIRPVELSRHINNRTIYELSKSSSHWRKLNINGVEPSKLLTEINEDEYSIYENRIYKSLLNKLDSRLDMIVNKRETLLNNVKKAHKIKDNIANTYKNALLFQKMAPKQLEDLQKVSIIEVEKSLEDAKVVQKKIAFLKMQDLYYMLKNEREVNSPLKKTNLLLQDRHYKRLTELWDKYDEHTLKLAEGASDDGEFLEIEEKHYALYVYMFGLVLLKDLGYKSSNDVIGNLSDHKFSYTGLTEQDCIEYKLEDSNIQITFKERIKNLIPLKDNYHIFFDTYNPKGINYLFRKGTSLHFDSELSLTQISKIQSDYKIFLSNTNNMNKKMKRFKEDIIDQLQKVIRTNIKTQDILLKVDISDINDSNASLLNYTDRLYDDIFNNLTNNSFDAVYYILPKLNFGFEFDIKERIYNRLNNVGENFRDDMEKDFISLFGNYKGGIFTVSHESLASLVRFSKMINIQHYQLPSIKDELSHTCPMCGSNHLDVTNNDYKCKICNSNWSVSKCTFCSNKYLYMNLKNSQFVTREKENIIDYSEILDIERGAMAFTNGVVIKNKFKTICPKCGKLKE